MIDGPLRRGLQIEPFGIPKVIETAGALWRAEVVAVGDVERGQAEVRDRRQDAKSDAARCTTAVNEDHPRAATSRNFPRGEGSQGRANRDGAIGNGEGRARIRWIRIDVESDFRSRLQRSVDDPEPAGYLRPAHAHGPEHLPVPTSPRNAPDLRPPGFCGRRKSDPAVRDGVRPKVLRDAWVDRVEELVREVPTHPDHERDRNQQERRRDRQELAGRPPQAAAVTGAKRLICFGSRSQGP